MLTSLNWASWFTNFCMDLTAFSCVALCSLNSFLSGAQLRKNGFVLAGSSCCCTILTNTQLLQENGGKEKKTVKFNHLQVLLLIQLKWQTNEQFDCGYQSGRRRRRKRKRRRRRRRRKVYSNCPEQSFYYLPIICYTCHWIEMIIFMVTTALQPKTSLTLTPYKCTIQICNSLVSTTISTNKLNELTGQTNAVKTEKYNFNLFPSDSHVILNMDQSCTYSVCHCQTNQGRPTCTCYTLADTCY